MSGRAWTWRHAILEAEIPATTKHVLLTISCFMNDVGEGCYRSTKDIARFSGLSERAVCTHIEQAVALGWLGKAQHGFRGQKWKRHEYEPRWPEKGAEPGSAPVEKARNDVRKGAEPDAKRALNVVQRDKKVSESISPSSPVESLQGTEGFGKLWDEWPERQRPQSRPYAEKMFLQLDPEDQTRAAKYAGRYLTTQLLRRSFPTMIPYLRDREFQEFDHGLPMTPNGEFRLTPDHPEWAAWFEYFRGKFNPANVDRQEKLGFLITKNRWPPKPRSPFRGFDDPFRPIPDDLITEGPK